jgi:2-octaprenylphenol hydroxylase
MDHYDIAICGGGLTGLLLANLLKSSRYSIAVIDAGAAPITPVMDSSAPHQGSFASGFAPRVSALNNHSVDLLARCGVEAGLTRFAPFSEMHIKDSEGVAEIQFDAAGLGQDGLGIVIENHLVIAALFEGLQGQGNVDLLLQHKLVELERFEDKNELEFAEHPAISCDLLVAADGGHSKVRELRGGKTLGWQYDQTALVTTLLLERPHGNIPRQWFTEFGPLAFLPLAEPNLVSIVWSHQAATELLALDPVGFCAALNEASEGELGNVLATDARFTFPLRQQHAIRYTEPGIALIGDAAHTIHPLAGQGANLGFADAAALASEIHQAKFSDLELHDRRLLQRFAASRQPHNLVMASAMEAIKQLYGRQNLALSFFRNRAMSLLNQSQTLKTLMMKVATGEGI